MNKKFDTKRDKEVKKFIMKTNFTSIRMRLFSFKTGERAKKKNKLTIRYLSDSNWAISKPTNASERVLYTYCFRLTLKKRYISLCNLNLNTRKINMPIWIGTDGSIKIFFWYLVTSILFYFHFIISFLLFMITSINK